MECATGKGTYCRISVACRIFTYKKYTARFFNISDQFNSGLCLLSPTLPLLALLFRYQNFQSVWSHSGQRLLTHITNHLRVIRHINYALVKEITNNCELSSAMSLLLSHDSELQQWAFVLWRELIGPTMPLSDSST